MGVESVTFYSCDGIVGIVVPIEILYQKPDWILSIIYKEKQEYFIKTNLTTEQIIDIHDYMNGPKTIEEPIETNVCDDMPKLES